LQRLRQAIGANVIDDQLIIDARPSHGDDVGQRNVAWRHLAAEGGGDLCAIASFNAIHSAAHGCAS
jgi:hypothetical protein